GCIRCRGAISAADAAAARIVFEHHLAREYRIVDVTRSTAQSAMVLAERYGLRGYDAVQLASALEVHAARMARSLPALTFVSADDDLNDAAHVGGLSVTSVVPIENPFPNSPPRRPERRG
ncbi:MAG: PIN domain-containing protein, partial [Acidobacteria bacterium]